jgi:hypothetical protein
MIESASAAMAAWAMAGLVWLAGWQSLWAALAIAAAATALWIAHVAVYSVKSAQRREACAARKQQIAPTRRRFIGYLGSAALGSALATAFPTLAKAGMYDCSQQPWWLNGEYGGYGSCGQVCQDTSGNTSGCPSNTRPVYQNSGACTCCEFPECA